MMTKSREMLNLPSLADALSKEEKSRIFSFAILKTEDPRRYGSRNPYSYESHSNIEGASGAIRIARRLLHLLKPPFEIEGHKVNLSARIGIGLCPEHGTDADTLLQRAARAVHQVKRMGIGYALYSAEQEELYTPTRLLLLHDLRQAPEQEQLLHYQPKVEMRSGAIHQVEALIRGGSIPSVAYYRRMIFFRWRRSRV